MQACRGTASAGLGICSWCFHAVPLTLESLPLSTEAPRGRCMLQVECPPLSLAEAACFCGVSSVTPTLSFAARF